MDKVTVIRTGMEMGPDITETVGEEIQLRQNNNKN